jgi:hypothetical protein
MVRHLPVLIPPPDELSRPPDGPTHPMRRVTVETATAPETWTPERAQKVADLFDGLAAEWHTRATPGRAVPLEDAFERGGAGQRGRCLELGSGTGLITPFTSTR